MNISINTPALLFPAITLLMVAYTSRFLALSTLIRNLHTRYKQVEPEQEVIRHQLRNLRTRLNLVRNMQAAGIASFFLCVLSMLGIFLDYGTTGVILFGASLVLLLLSLAISFREILISTRALEIELKDMED